MMRMLRGGSQSGRMEGLKGGLDGRRAGDEGKRGLGLYFHVPFCRSKCPYCAFYSSAVGSCGGAAAGSGGSGNAAVGSCGGAAAGSGGSGNSAVGFCGGAAAGSPVWISPEVEAEYIKGICEDLAAYGDEYPGRLVDTIYFGGGTPSLLRPGSLHSVLETVYSCFRVDYEPEITIEVNPGTEPDFALMRAMGINRVSLGCQSFDNRVLRAIGRLQSAEENFRAFEDARRYFDNISLDLMFGLPEQTKDVWMDSVRKTIELSPEHISFYGLQIEPGTPFYKKYKNGEIPEIDWSFYYDALKLFQQSGYEHYEISSLAKKGKESRHNMKYWNFEEYLGIGPSASSFIDGARFKEGAPDLVPEYHQNTFSDNVSEYTFTGLRRRDGINFKDFRNRFNKDFETVFPGFRKELEPFVQAGQVALTEESIKILPKGITISNNIMEIFVL